MSELVLNWYTILSQPFAVLAPSVAAAREAINVPVVSAVLLGVLAMLAPCQMTTNAGALAFLARKVAGGAGGAGAAPAAHGYLGTAAVTVRAAVAYLLGKATVYTLIGAVVLILGQQASAGVVPIAQVARKALGPLMLLLALVTVGAVRWQVSFGGGARDWLEARISGRGAWDAYLLGVAFSFAFCPTLFWLFFGLLLPLSLATPGLGFLFPGLFALGTTLPLLVFAGLLAGSARLAQAYVRQAKAAGGAVRWAAAAVLLAAGLNDTFTYWVL